MYSHEDRLRAVRLYIKLGQRVALTIRQLGYPTKNALKSWHREYERHLDLPAGYARQPKYSQAEKEQAVKHCLEHGRCFASTIKALGYPSRILLPAWVLELHPGSRARRWTIPGADACNEALRGHCIVHATRRRTVGSSRAGRVSAIAA
jgi:transposase-like protein